MQDKARASRLPTNVREAISVFMRVKNERRMVSTFTAVKHIREQFSDIDVSDITLTDTIAAAAIIHDLDVVVDFSASAISLFDRWTPVKASH